MVTLDLKSYFDSINYKWQDDLKQLSHICQFTKTRVNPYQSGFVFSYGMEQTFLIKALAQSLGVKKFFEIGTGRGTASYAVSLVESITKIITVDILPFTYVRDTAINYKPARASNCDLYNLIDIDKKSKIKFHLVNDYPYIISNFSNSFDLAFIDGCHEDANIILNDFHICMKLLRKGGYILWDDYDPNKFEVAKVVDFLIQKHNLDCSLIEFRGHLFGDYPPESNAGLVLMKINENLY